MVGVISSTNDPGSASYRSLKIPVVFLDRISSDRPAVYADGREGGRIAAQQMVQRGSQRVTVMQGPAHIRPAQDRFQGAIEALQDMGVSYRITQTTSFSFTEADRWARELFEQYPDTDGVIASNDITATAVIQEAHRLGKKIPGDIQIIGFDDTPLSSLLSPALSTIRQPAYDMGRAAADLLIQLIEGTAGEQRTIQMPVEFIERETTRPLS